jgi:hypothetical protein
MKLIQRKFNEINSTELIQRKFKGIKRKIYILEIGKSENWKNRL